MTGLDGRVLLHLVKFRSLVWVHSAGSPAVTGLSKMATHSLGPLSFWPLIIY